MSTDNININLVARNRAGPAINQARGQVRSLRMEAVGASRALARTAQPIGGAVGGGIGRAGAAGAILAGGPIGVAMLGAAAGFAAVSRTMQQNAEMERRRIEFDRRLQEERKEIQRTQRAALRTSARSAVSDAQALADAEAVGLDLQDPSIRGAVASGMDPREVIKSLTDSRRRGVGPVQERVALLAAGRHGTPLDEALEIASEMRGAQLVDGGTRHAAETVAIRSRGMRDTERARSMIRGENERRVSDATGGRFLIARQMEERLQELELSLSNIITARTSVSLSAGGVDPLVDGVEAYRAQIELMEKQEAIIREGREMLEKRRGESRARTGGDL